MTRSAELAEALLNTYAAHVHNAVTDTFVIDLIREVGALVLDRDPNSASVATAVKILDDPPVLDELRKDYRMVLPSQWMGGQNVPLDVRQAIELDLEEAQIVENLAEFDAGQAKVAQIQGTVLNSHVGESLRVARNKSVAHYDTVRDGQDWKLWRIEGTGLTYGQMDEYIDACTSAVDVLLRLVSRTAHDFNGTREIAHDYATDYIGALILGLRRKKELHAARLSDPFGELHASSGEA
jgi:hypothetical protein